MITSLKDYVRSCRCEKLFEAISEMLEAVDENDAIAILMTAVEQKVEQSDTAQEWRKLIVSTIYRDLLLYAQVEGMQRQ